MAKMDDTELLSIVDSEFEGAMGAPGGEISQERAEAWDYYLGKPFGNEIEGQSQVVTSDVSDAIDGVMPSLLRVFTVSENLIDFDPVGPEDIAKARQESDYVNHVFFKKNPAFVILYTWFFDALAQKNGIVKAWWDDSESSSTESYRGLNDQELAELLSDDELEPIEREEREIELDIETAALTGYQEAAILAAAESRQTVTVTATDIKFRRTTKTGSVRIENVPPEEFRISSDARSVDPSDARFIGQEREVTRSDLIEMGFDKEVVDGLPAYGSSDSDESRARYDKTDEDKDGHTDRSQDAIMIREAYLRVDHDGDGISELRQIISAGGEVLSNEEIDRQPFHVISSQPLPHKHFGRALSEKVMDIQRIQSTLVRQILDNLYQSNNPSHAVWEQGIGENTLDDLLTTRVGSIKRFARPVQESWAPISVPFTAGATFPMLEYWEKAKRDRTGVHADGEGLSPEQLKNIQTTVMAQANDLSRMKIEAIVRIFAETGVKSLFRHIHELLLKHQNKEEIVFLRNNWVPINPQEWRSRSDLTVQIGLGVGSKEQNLVHLENLFQKQKEIVAAGGSQLVTADNVFNLMNEMVKNASLKNAELYFTNPANAPPQTQNEGPSEQAQLGMMQIQTEAQKNEISRERMMLEHQRKMQELQLKQQEQEIDLRVKLEEIANTLTELDLKFQETAVPGSRV